MHVHVFQNFSPNKIVNCFDQSSPFISAKLYLFFLILVVSSFSILNLLKLNFFLANQIGEIN